MLTELLHCHGIHLLVPGLFSPVVFSMQLPVASETQSTIPTSLLVFVGNIFTPLVSFIYMHQFMYVHNANGYGRKWAGYIRKGWLQLHKLAAYERAL